MASKTEVGDHITGQVDGALAGLGEGPFVSQASCVDVLLDLFAATGGTALQPLVAAGLAHISRVNLVEVARFRDLLLELAAMATVAEVTEGAEVLDVTDAGDGPGPTGPGDDAEAEPVLDAA